MTVWPGISFKVMTPPTLSPLSMTSPNTLSSWARVLLCGRRTSCVLANLIKGLTCLSAHIPSRPLSLTPADLRRCANDLAAMGPIRVVARVAVLFVVPEAIQLCGWSGGYFDHLLTRRNLDFHQGGLNVTVRSTKTIWDPRDAMVIPVAVVPGSPTAQL